jgi:Fic family protein
MAGQADEVSQNTALRDISDLVIRQILVKDQAGGRIKGYTLCRPQQ